MFFFFFAHLLAKHLFQRLFMLPRHARQHAPFLIPDAPLGPGAAHRLVGLRIDVGAGARFGLDALALARHLVQKLVEGARCLALALPRRPSLPDPLELLGALGPSPFRREPQASKAKERRWAFGLRFGLQLRFELQRQLVLPAPRARRPLLVPDALLDPAPLDVCFGEFVIVPSKWRMRRALLNSPQFFGLFVLELTRRKRCVPVQFKPPFPFVTASLFFAG
jgi:hypothetical protein